MNTYTRNLIASLILAPLAPLGLYALYRGSWELAASFGVVAGLAVLGVIDLRALVLFGSLIAVSLFVNTALVELKKGG